MPKLKHKFIVFKDDTEIFKYIPEDDDKFLEEGTAFLYDTLKEAKEVALANFEDQLNSIQYKDFK